MAVSIDQDVYTARVASATIFGIRPTALKVFRGHFGGVKTYKVSGAAFSIIRDGSRIDINGLKGKCYRPKGSTSTPKNKKRVFEVTKLRVTGEGWVDVGNVIPTKYTIPLV
jgi:hypothetical protein